MGDLGEGSPQDHPWFFLAKFLEIVKIFVTVLQNPYKSMVFTDFSISQSKEQLRAQFHQSVYQYQNHFQTQFHLSFPAFLIASQVSQWA